MYLAFSCGRRGTALAVDEESKTKSEHYMLIDSNVKCHSIAFSFDTISAKEKASQKENAVFFGGSAPLDPASFLKKT